MTAENRPLLADVKSFGWTDLDPEAPELPTLLSMYVGPRGEQGEEQFQIMVATLASLEPVLARTPMLVGRHWLVVADFVPSAIEAHLRKLVESLSAATWPELAAKVSRIGLWEFEDYQES